MEQLNLYEILGVSQDADINVIREAYGKIGGQSGYSERCGAVLKPRTGV